MCGCFSSKFINKLAPVVSDIEMMMKWRASPINIFILYTHKDTYLYIVTDLEWKHPYKNSIFKTISTNFFGFDEK